MSDKEIFTDTEVEPRFYLRERAQTTISNITRPTTPILAFDWRASDIFNNGSTDLL